LAATSGGAAIATTSAGVGTQTAFGNPLMFTPHPCPSFTGSGNSGCTSIIDHNGAVDEPLFSRAKRKFGGKQSNLGGNSIGFQQPNARVWGTLMTMTVNVIRPATTGTLTVSSVGFTQPNLVLSNFSEVIDVTVAGLRTVTNLAVTGSAGADALTAYADWLSGPLVWTWTNPPATGPNSAIVKFSIRTDQGIVEGDVMYGAPNIPASGTNLWVWMASGVLQQYNSLP
jgi:hypothetical protein